MTEPAGMKYLGVLIKMKKLLIFLLLILTPCYAIAQVDTLQLNWDLDIIGYILCGKIHHAYGGFQDSNVTIDLTQNNWVQVTNDENDLWSGLEADGFSLSGDTMYVGYDMDIDGEPVVITFNGSSQKEYQFRLYNVTQTRQEGFLQGKTGEGTRNLS